MSKRCRTYGAAVPHVRASRRRQRSLSRRELEKCRRLSVTIEDVEEDELRHLYQKAFDAQAQRRLAQLEGPSARWYKREIRRSLRRRSRQDDKRTRRRRTLDEMHAHLVQIEGMLEIIRALRSQVEGESRNTMPESSEVVPTTIGLSGRSPLSHPSLPYTPTRSPEPSCLPPENLWLRTPSPSSP